LNKAFFAAAHESVCRWRHGDWVLWDNRSVMHQANPDYGYLYRLMLKGETPV
jgi:alpha-ketoglutarate-dependent taurine dioxygenase